MADATGDPAAAEHLSLAAAAMDEFVGSLAADVRSRVLARVPMNRLTEAARRAAARQVDRALARVDVPLGRSVGDGDLVTVSWTLLDPADAAIVDPAERRRHVLARLVGEAAAQGGAPTDGDLASALGVSRRTIIRDAQKLVRAGRPLDTRRRPRMGSAEAAHD